MFVVLLPLWFHLALFLDRPVGTIFLMELLQNCETSKWAAKVFTGSFPEFCWSRLRLKGEWISFNWYSSWWLELSALKHFSSKLLTQVFGAKTHTTNLFPFHLENQWIRSTETWTPNYWALEWEASFKKRRLVKNRKNWNYFCMIPQSQHTTRIKSLIPVFTCRTIDALYLLNIVWGFQNEPQHLRESKL